MGVSEPGPLTVAAVSQSGPQIIANALQDENLRNRLLTDPAATFRQNGLDVANVDRAFNEFFRQAAPDLVATLKNPGEQVEGSDLRAQGFGCSLCKASVWADAIIIIALGTAAIAALTPESEIVLATAAVLGIASVEETLALIQTLSPGVIAAGVNAVASKMCEWAGEC